MCKPHDQKLCLEFQQQLEKKTLPIKATREPKWRQQWTTFADWIDRPRQPYG